MLQMIQIFRPIPRFSFVGAIAMLAGCGQGLVETDSTSKRVTQISLAQGDITLTAPRGYCVDERAVRSDQHNSFAVLARCDTLGVRGGFSTQDLALITVTTVTDPTGTQPDATSLAQSAKPAEVMKTQSLKGRPFVLLENANHNVNGASPRHWRSAFALNGHLVGLALYASEGSDILTAQGANLLSDLASKTIKASATPTLAAKKPD
jgi:hypothetical protein